MASSMNVWCEIIKLGLAKRRRRDATEVATLVAAGVGEDEATRRVYYPWKTIEQYREMLAEYARVFGDP